MDDEEPTIPLLTSTRFKEPVFEIGPMFVVPNPTLLTFKNSSSTFSKSPTMIEVIPAKDIIEVDIETCPPTLSDSVVVMGVNDIGDWIISSIVIK